MQPPNPTDPVAPVLEAATEVANLSKLGYIKLALISFIEACQAATSLLRFLLSQKQAAKDAADQTKDDPKLPGRD
jgi:hypothetical protein